MPSFARLPNYFDLAGRIALVTGASSGIGAATARVLADMGASVAVGFHRNRAGAEDTCASILAAGGRALPIEADVRLAAEVRAMVVRTTAALGPIDILVNNAGSLVARRTLADITEAFWDDIHALNARSVMLVSRAVVPSMVERGRGAIINVGSIAGHHGGGPGAAPYASAKAAVMAFTKGLARELAATGVRVNAVAPGVIDTPFHAQFSTPEMLRAFTATIPLGRVGTPMECATVIAFLASDAASYLIGETIEINGGQLMV
jgi:3-oxoacyl-[acyl-carrier protein] reductase